MQLFDALSNPDLGYDDALRLILAHFKAETGTIHTLGPDGLLHLEAYSPGLPEPVIAASRVIPIGKGIAGQAAERLEPVRICNIQTDTSGVTRPGAKATGAQGAVCVPLMDGSRLAGTLGIATMSAREFTEAEASLLMEAGRTLAERRGEGRT